MHLAILNRILTTQYCTVTQTNALMPGNTVCATEYLLLFVLHGSPLSVPNPPDLQLRELFVSALASLFGADIKY